MFLDGIRFVLKVIFPVCGVWINQSNRQQNKLFQNSKRKVIGNARKMANITNSVIEKSCKKLLIGKHFGKV